VRKAYLSGGSEDKMARDPYDILGVPRDADDEQIRKAYHRLAKERHPDAGGDNDEYFCRLNDAYETLRTEERRRAYDRSRRPAQGSGRRSPRARRSSEEQPAGRFYTPQRAAPWAGLGAAASSGWAEFFSAPEFADPFRAVEEIVERFMRGGAGFSASSRSYEAAVRLRSEQAHAGASVRLEFPDRPRTIEIPPGVRDGDVLSYRETDAAGAVVALELAVYVD
jgi:curved DNA-binding protein CbpA